jgi:hypothetical protein
MIFKQKKHLLTNKKLQKMKKIILFLIAMLAFVQIADAQLARVAAPLAENIWFQPTYTGVAADTLGTVTATTWSLATPVNKFDGVFFIYEIKLADKTTGAAGVCTVQPQGKYFATGAYVNIGSAITWTGVNSTDTTITIASVSNKVYYPYLRLLVTNTGGKSKIVSQKLIIKK